MAGRAPARRTYRRVRIRRMRAACLLLAAGASAAAARSCGSVSSRAAPPLVVVRGGDPDPRNDGLRVTAWPARGQAAVQIGQSPIQAGPNQHPAAIASVAKVMTAYLILRDHPLRLGEE